MDFQIPFEKLRGTSKVGVQLPDGLKPRAAEIAEMIEERGYKVIVSGETCFGACDIDMNLLGDVDVLLHFCHSPVVDVENVIYVPCFVEYDPNFDLQIPEKHVALISTVQYIHKLPEVAKNLRKQGYEVEIGKGSRRISYPGQVLGCNYSVLRDVRAEAVLFVGDGLFHAIGAAIYTKKTVYAFNPLSRELKRVEAGDFLKKRYFQVSRCVGKRRVGILVSSKPGQRRWDVAFRLEEEAKKAGMLAHVIYLNNIRAEELYNLSYEFYVNTACPRISYDDVFDMPVLTPTEFEFLLGKKGDIEVDEID